MPFECVMQIWIMSEIKHLVVCEKQSTTGWSDAAGYKHVTYIVTAINICLLTNLLKKEK